MIFKESNKTKLKKLANRLQKCLANEIVRVATFRLLCKIQREEMKKKN